MKEDISRNRTLAVLMAAHNRRELTLRALRSLSAVPKDINLAVVLLDDASIDGTGEAVLSIYPDTIVLKGDGNAFWNGGMYQAWSRALSLGVDGYLWLNDDVALDGDALERLNAAWKAHDRDDAVILVGGTRDSRGQMSYGGMRHIHTPFAFRFDRLPLSDMSQPADTFNGNIVLVSRAVVDQIGLNDPNFLHTLGDIDYGLRASKAGIPILQLPGTLGVCERNAPIDLARMTFRQRWRHMTSHRGIPLKSWWRVTQRHSGFWLPLHFLLAYRQVIRPKRHKAENEQG